MLTLIELATRYNNRCGGGPGYLHQWKVLLRRLPWGAKDLTPDRIDAYLTGALTHLSPSTVHRHRRMLQLLMQFAKDEGLLNRRIVLRKLRRVKVPPPKPKAWSHAEIGRLLAVAANMRRGTKVCPYSTLMPAWILAAYDTGLRTEDLRALRRDAIRGNHALISQEKTGEPHVVALSDRTLRAIAALPKIGPTVFGGLISGVQILRIMRRCVKLAGLTGTTKFLRRSGATYCEIAGRDASTHLGHRSPGMKKHYVDRLLVAAERNVTPPPELPESA
jgi:integrase